MVASVLRFPDNLSEDKHVESELVPRLDRGSSPLNSTEQYKLLNIKEMHLAQKCILRA